MVKGVGLRFKSRYQVVVAFFNMGVQIEQELFRGLSRHEEGSQVPSNLLGRGLWGRVVGLGSRYPQARGVWGDQ